MKLDVLDRLAIDALGGIRLGTPDHFRRHVNPDGFAGRSDLGRGQEYVQTPTAT